MVNVENLDADHLDAAGKTLLLGWSRWKKDLLRRVMSVPTPTLHSTANPFAIAGTLSGGQEAFPSELVFQAVDRPTRLCLARYGGKPIRGDISRSELRARFELVQPTLDVIEDILDGCRQGGLSGDELARTTVRCLGLKQQLRSIIDLKEVKPQDRRRLRQEFRDGSAHLLHPSRHAIDDRILKQLADVGSSAPSPAGAASELGRIGREIKSMESAGLLADIRATTAPVSQVRDSLDRVERIHERLREIRETLPRSAPPRVRDQLDGLERRAARLVEIERLNEDNLRRLYAAMTSDWPEWRREVLQRVLTAKRRAKPPGNPFAPHGTLGGGTAVFPDPAPGLRPLSSSGTGM